MMADLWGRLKQLFGFGGCPCCEGGECECPAECESCDCSETKASEMTEDVSGSTNHVNHINPVEVQGSEDIMGAETGGRYYGSVLARRYPGLTVPNPRDYPTPAANNAWAPFVNVKTYDDLKNLPLQPYPSAMEWATDPRNYQPYKSQEDYTSLPGNY